MTDMCVECGIENAATESDRCEACEWALKKDQFAVDHLGRTDHGSADDDMPGVEPSVTRPTPGPWYWHDQKGHLYVDALLDDDTVVDICEGVRNSADASLITAAHEMLAALKVVLEYIEDGMDFDDPPVQHAVVKRAIEKAGG